MTPEFSRPVRIDTLGAAPKTLTVEADAAERAGLARRFDLVAIEHLHAELSMVRSGAIVTASGRLQAKAVQTCVASGLDVANDIDAPFQLLFSPDPDGGRSDEEIELSESDCDVVFYDGNLVDVGEAVAQSLSLNLDPWPRAPGADEALKAAGVKSEVDAGPFAALAGLKDRLSKP